MGFKDVFLQHPERRYIMFGGGGGVGKTTFSAAAAYWLASQGKKVLVFSVDPQASLTDIFKRDIFGKGPVQIMDNLWAQEIDADSHIRKYQQEIRQKILDMYGTAGGARGDRALHPGGERRARDGRERNVRRRRRCRHEGRLRLLHLRSRPARSRALLLVDGQGLRRVDQQGHQAAGGDARIRGDGEPAPAREGERAGPDPAGAALHQKPHQHVGRDLHGQDEDGLLLCGDPGGRDHQRHAEGGPDVCAVRRAGRRLRGEPGHPARTAGPEYPGVPAAPDRYAGPPSGGYPDQRSTTRCWRWCRRWSATSRGWR